MGERVLCTLTVICVDIESDVSFFSQIQVLILDLLFRPLSLFKSFWFVEASVSTIPNTKHILYGSRWKWIESIAAPEKLFKYPQKNLDNR